MKILVVDDSILSRQVIKDMLSEARYDDLVMLDSGTALLEYLELDKDKLQNPEYIPDLILLDVVMKGIDGIDVCKQIKSKSRFRDIQIIMVTSRNDETELEKAFTAGARDYITKPYRKVELLARVASTLQLKKESDIRKSHELEMLKLAAELNQANNTLKKLSFIDALTGIPNRRFFDQIVKEECQKAELEKLNIAIFMIDIDYFKKYNDTYGHMYGDETLKKVAVALKGSSAGNSDIVARYGGEEFIAYLPDCNLDNAKRIAEAMNKSVRQLGIPHLNSEAADIVTVSIGIASIVPNGRLTLEKGISFADKALYKAKESGRNCFKSVKVETK